MVRQAREDSGTTVRELADMLGCSTQWVYQLERDDSDPRKSTMERVAGALGIELTIGGTG